MAENPYKSQKSLKIDNTKQETTDNGPHRGGNKYNQMKVVEGFIVHNPIPGHTQKKNINVDKK